jgi:hypothetical protein
MRAGYRGSTGLCARRRTQHAAARQDADPGTTVPAAGARTCQYLAAQRSTQLLSPTLSEPSLYLQARRGVGSEARLRALLLAQNSGAAGFSARVRAQPSRPAAHGLAAHALWQLSTILQEGGRAGPAHAEGEPRRHRGRRPRVACAPQACPDAQGLARRAPRRPLLPCSPTAHPPRALTC